MKVAPWVPRPLGLRLSALAGRLAGRLSGDRHAVRSNLAVVLGPDAERKALDELTRQVFATQACNYFDMFHFGGRPAAEVAHLTDFTNLVEVLEGIGDSGVVAVTLHYGNLDIVAQSISMAGVDALAAVERLQPPELFELVCSLRARTGLEVVPVDRASMALLRALRAGRMVVLAADRDVEGDGVPTTFFSRPALLPDGYARLAVLAGVPILLASSHRKADGGFELSVRRLDVPPSITDREAAVSALVAAALDHFETVIGGDPSQWVLFRDVWPTPRAHKSTEAAPNACAAGSGQNT